MKKIHLLTLAAGLAFAGAAHAQTETFQFNLADSATGVEATGTITGTYTSPGVYTGTSGTLTATIGGQSYTTTLAPAGISIGDIDPPAATVTLSGADNLIGTDYLSGYGMLFTNPATTQSGAFAPPEDVIALSANTSNTGYELDWLGSDFPSTPYPYNADTDLTGTIEEVPEPTSWALGLVGLGMVLALRRNFLRA
jgi:hypothetical protein